MVSTNGKTVLIIVEIKRPTNPTTTSEIKKKNEKGKENFSTEHTLTPNKKAPSRRFIVVLSNLTTTEMMTHRLEQPRTS